MNNKFNLIPITPRVPDRIIFREYDIRGIVNQNLYEEDVFNIGKAFASFLNNQGSNTIVICRDGRLSSPSLGKALKAGILSTGTNLIDIGIGPTPLLYFATYQLNSNAGIMLTGSHNPPQYNGLKFIAYGKPFFGADIQMLRSVINNGSFIEGKGTELECQQNKLQECYIDKMLAKVTKAAVKVAWDTGNGAAGEIVRKLIKRLPGEHILLNEAIDGNFPSHAPDPTRRENLTQLISTIKKEQCDFGIAFDGDADRIVAVDNLGRMVEGDQLIAIFAKDIIKNHPSAKVIADVKTSEELFEYIKQLGGEAIMWKTGHSHIKAKMLEEKALLGGELSGHIFFADEYYGFDDGIYAACRLIKALESEQKLSDVIDGLPKSYNSDEIRIECSEERKFAIIEEVKQLLKQQGIIFNDLDGIRAKNVDGWWLLRASNTQNVLVARCGAKTQAGLVKLESNLQTLLADINVTFSN
jgi:phosphomannomutase